jgi:tetratricopeptide (TPR) repeat protein
MYNNSFKQKIALIAFGLLLGIILIEIGLRLGGLGYLYFQERANRISLEQKGEYVILCLGESTTQAGGKDSYPRQLERVLNQRTPRIKFSVINKGLAGTNTTSIVSVLEKNLDKYHPDMVITMMGINDPPGGIVAGSLSKPFFMNLRIYKLMKWINERFHHSKYVTRLPVKSGREISVTKTGTTILKGKSINNNSPQLGESPAVGLIETGDQFRDQNKLEEAARMYQKASLLDPETSYWKYLDLAVLYHRRYQNWKRAEKYYLKALELKPDHDAAYVFGEQESGLAALYRERNYLSKAKEMAKKAIEINPVNALAYSELGRISEIRGKIEEAITMYEKSISLNKNYNSPFVKLSYLYRHTGRWEQLEELCKTIIKAKPDDDRAYATLIICYQEQGKTELAKKYITKLEELRTSSHNQVTVRNYRKLAAVLKRKNIKLVCVQYPIRDLNNLKKMLPEKEGIIFVDNKDIFKEALKQSCYEDYFSDQFAGDFGHCTPIGNYLLAKNIADILLASCFENLRTIQSCPENTQAERKDRFERLNLLTSEANIWTASSRNLKDQTVDKLTDNDKLTYWHVSLERIGEPAWIIIDFGEGNEKMVRSLTALPRTDKPRQFFRNAKLFGSNNGDVWEQISEIIQEEVPDSDTWKEWKINNDRAYRYCKLLIIDGHEDGNNHHFYSMAELAVL